MMMPVDFRIQLDILVSSVPKLEMILFKRTQKDCILELLLTSFGLSHLSYRHGEEVSRTDIFYRMPPASLSMMGMELMPDYAVLLLAEKIILDEKTYERLLRSAHPFFGQMALIVKKLHDNGFIRLVDFDTIIKENQPLLKKMLDRDLKELDSWVTPLKESLEEWKGFTDKFNSSLRENFFLDRSAGSVSDAKMSALNSEYQMRINAWLHSFGQHSMYTRELINYAIRSSRERRKSETRHALREGISEYLAYINANLVLSKTFEAGFYDWSDFRPFYRDKFLRIGHVDAPGEREEKQIKKLFTVSFPELTFWNPDNIIKALKDKRIEELRGLVQSAVNGKTDFDGEFAKRVLSEVLSIERSIGKLRNIVSYATLPLGFIPVAGTPIQKAVEEAIVQPIARKKSKNYRWFYLISELANTRNS